MYNKKSFPSHEEYRIGSVKSIITFPPLLQLNYILNVEISRWKAVRECEVSHVQMILLVHFPFLLLFLSSKGFVSGQSESNVDHPEIFMIETEETKQKSVDTKEEGGSDHSTDQVTTLKKWIILIILYKTPFVSCCKHETKDSFMHWPISGGRFHRRGQSAGVQRGRLSRGHRDRLSSPEQGEADEMLLQEGGWSVS